MRKEYKGKISIGRYLDKTGSECFVEINVDHTELTPRILFEMSLCNFAKAITGRGDCEGIVTIWINDQLAQKGNK